MDILTQTNDSKETINYLNVLKEDINALLSPIIFEPSAFNYGKFISNFGLYIYSVAKDALKKSIRRNGLFFL